jgi:hypothetical protein
MSCFCIKKLNIKIEKITDTVFKITDLSDIQWGINQKLDGLVLYVDLNVESPAKETFSISIPVGSSLVFDASQLNICPLLDGIYCVNTESCGVNITTHVGYFGNLKCDIDNLLLRNIDDPDLFLCLQDKFEVLETVAGYQMKDEAQSIYNNIEETIKGCVGKC